VLPTPPDETCTVARRDGGELVVRVLSAAQTSEKGLWVIEVKIDAWQAGLVLLSDAKTRKGAIGDVRRTIAGRQDQLLAEILAGHLGKRSPHVSPQEA
jgi:hypothetical protein